MSLELRVCLIVLSIGSLLYIIRKIRNSKMQIEYSLFWIVLSLILIVISIFPQIVYWVTRQLHMMSPSNVVFVFIVGVLLLKVFMMTIEISKLENKVSDLAQKIGIYEKESRDEWKRFEKQEEKQDDER